MNEISALAKVIEHLDEQNYSFFVDSGYGRPEIEEFADMYDNCGMNNTISIGSRIPDVIGFSPEQNLFAIEVKGENDIRKGIGQAAFYRRGVHESYLAADRSALAEFRETAVSCGLGTYEVNSKGISSIERPPENIAATQIGKMSRALQIKTAKFESSEDTFPSMSRPINSLLPVVAIAGEGDGWALSKSECVDVIKNSDQGYRQPNAAIRLAETLGLVKESYTPEANLHLTDIGQAGFYHLVGHRNMRDQSDLKDEDIVQDLFLSIDDLKTGTRDPLYVNHSDTAAYLRDRFLSVPDVRLLTQILAEYEGTKAELSRILVEVASASPDVFLNLFCGRGKELKFRRLIENYRTDVNRQKFRQSLLDLTSSNALYNFVYNIRHVGILNSDSDAVHQNKELVVNEFFWEWDKDTTEIERESY